MFKIIPFAFIILILLSSIPAAQESRSGWKRTAEPTQIGLQLFSSTHAIGLPTAESHKKGDFEFEISHRFFPPIADGHEALYGFDGPVNMRIALGYALTDDILITLGRSNVEDNIDLWLKWKALTLENEKLPTLISFRIGADWSVIETFHEGIDDFYFIRKKFDSHHFQGYAQGIINSLFKDRFGLGLVPSYLFNRDISFTEREHSFILGSYGQIFINDRWALMGEWSITLTDKFGKRNPGAFGIELNTGGHFFKVFVTNQTSLNPAQFLAGADYPFAADQLRFGFLITRLL